MKVEVEKEPDSVSTLHIELPPEQVAKEWNAIAENFALGLSSDRIPGVQTGVGPPGFRGHATDEFVTVEHFIKGIKFGAGILDRYGASAST